MLSSRPTALRRARSRSVTIAAGVLAVFGGAVLTAGPAAAAGDPLAALRQCESSGNYATNTGNGFYGAYQFDAQTWRGLGLSGLPSTASPATQDAAVRTLQAQRGWQPWPACSAHLGLNSATPVTATTTTAATPALPVTPLPRASRTRPVESSSAKPEPQTTTTAPPAAHAAPAQAASAQAAPPQAAPAGAVVPQLPLFTVGLAGQVRADVRAWQQAMVQRGFALAIDGRYGPKSAQATHEFEVQHGLHVEAVGIVGQQVRRALASTPTAAR